MDWLANKFEIREPNDWYRVRATDLQSHHGQGLLTHYKKSSLFPVLANVYPQHSWYFWKFSDSPLYMWKDPHNLQQYDNKPKITHYFRYFHWLAGTLDVRNPQAWSRVTVEDVRRHGGEKLIQLCDGDLSKLLLKIFPNSVKPWEVSAPAPVGYWDSIDNQRQFFDQIAKDLRLNRIEDWYGIPKQAVLQKKGGSAVLARYNNSLCRGTHFSP